MRELSPDALAAIRESYEAAIAVIQKIDDEEYRTAAIEGAVAIRVKRERGHTDLGGPLAMRLRREAQEDTRE